MLVGLAWLLNLRRNREGLKLTLTIGLLLAIPLGMYSVNSFYGERLVHFCPLVLTCILGAYLLYCALPRNEVDHYQHLDKRQRHYLYLFLAFVVIGPLPLAFSIYYSFLAILGKPDISTDESLAPEPTYWDLSTNAYLTLPLILMIGALVWKLKLKGDPIGHKILILLGFLTPELLISTFSTFAIWGAYLLIMVDLPLLILFMVCKSTLINKQDPRGRKLLLLLGFLMPAILLVYAFIPNPWANKIFFIVCLPLGFLLIDFGVVDMFVSLLSRPKQTPPQLNSTPPELKPQQLDFEPDKSSTLTRDYLTLLPAFVLLGPLISLLLTLLVPTKVNGLGADNVDWGGLYFLFAVPALITGLFIWAGKLHRGWRGSINTVLINMLAAGLYGALYRHPMHGEENVFDLILPPFVALPALLLSIFLPRPEKNHD